jgi:hypothetical protein
MKVNIHFNNLNTDKVNELYLFYRLRMFAMKNGGLFRGFNFSKTEKYDVLPKLVKLGWISGEKVTKYRSLVLESKCSNIYANITEGHLSDIKTFKGTIISYTEKYLLDVKRSIAENKRVKRDSLGRKVKVNWGTLRVASKMLLKTEKKIDDFGCKEISGRAFNDELSRLMNLSTSTISRWRKESKDNGFNQYDLRSLQVNDNVERGFKQVAKKRLKTKSTYTSRVCGNTFTKDLIITSSIDLFTINPHKAGNRRSSVKTAEYYKEKYKNFSK